MSRYNWSQVPSWVNWIATDEDGEVWGYSDEPKLGCFSYFYKENGLKIFVGYNASGNDWQDSLEERLK